MPKKVFTTEQIVTKLREIEVSLARGNSVSPVGGGRIALPGGVLHESKPR